MEIIIGIIICFVIFIIAYTIGAVAHTEPLPFPPRCSSDLPLPCFDNWEMSSLRMKVSGLENKCSHLEFLLHLNRTGKRQRDVFAKSIKEQELADLIKASQKPLNKVLKSLDLK